MVILVGALEVGAIALVEQFVDASLEGSFGALEVACLVLDSLELLS